MRLTILIAVGLLFATTPANAQPAKPEKVTIAGFGGTVRVVFGRGGQFAAFSEDESIRMYNAKNGVEMLRLKDRISAAVAAAFTPDGKTLAVSDSQAIHFVQTSTGKITAAGGGALGNVERLAFSPDAKLLACAARGGEVRLWDVETQKLARSFNAEHPADTPIVVFSVAWSPDGKHLAQAYTDGHPGKSYLRLWDPATGRLERMLIDGAKTDIWDAVFAPNCQLLVAGDTNGNITVFETKGWTKVKEFKVDDQLRSLAFAFNNRKLAIGGRHDIYLCDPTTGKVLKTLTGHTNWVLSLAFAPDSATLASGSSDKTARIWPVD